MACITDNTRKSTEDMEHTRSLWVRLDHDRNETELWVDGANLATWDGVDVTKIVAHIAETAYERGVVVGRVTNQMQLRDALGLKQ